MDTGCRHADRNRQKVSQNEVCYGSEEEYCCSAENTPLVSGNRVDRSVGGTTESRQAKILIPDRGLVLFLRRKVPSASHLRGASFLMQAALFPGIVAAFPSIGIPETQPPADSQSGIERPGLFRAAEKNNHPSLLAYWPGFGVAARLTQHDYAHLAAP